MTRAAVNFGKRKRAASTNESSHARDRAAVASDRTGACQAAPPHLPWHARHRAGRGSRLELLAVAADYGRRGVEVHAER